MSRRSLRGKIHEDEARFTGFESNAIGQWPCHHVMDLDVRGTVRAADCVDDRAAMGRIVMAGDTEHLPESRLRQTAEDVRHQFRHHLWANVDRARKRSGYVIYAPVIGGHDDTVDLLLRKPS